MSDTKIVFEWKEGEPADLAFMRAFSELLRHMTWQEAHALANWIYSKAHDPNSKFRPSHMTMSRGGDVDRGRDGESQGEKP